VGTHSPNGCFRQIEVPGQAEGLVRFDHTDEVMWNLGELARRRLRRADRHAGVHLP
jgi:hypothetical protein